MVQLSQPRLGLLVSSLGHVRRQNGIAHGEDTAGGYGQLVHADAEEQLGQLRICAQLAADACPDACLVGILHGHADHVQHGGVMGIVEIIQRRVLPDDGQGVLCPLYTSYAADETTCVDPGVTTIS